MLSLPEREVLLARATAHIPNVRAASHNGLTVGLARGFGASVLVGSAAGNGRPNSPWQP